VEMIAAQQLQMQVPDGKRVQVVDINAAATAVAAAAKAKASKNVNEVTQ